MHAPAHRATQWVGVPSKQQTRQQGSSMQCTNTLLHAHWHLYARPTWVSCRLHSACSLFMPSNGRCAACARLAAFQPATALCWSAGARRNSRSLSADTSAHAPLAARHSSSSVLKATCGAAGQQ